mmetsp:Transcript_88125/g.189190  ORF Transcript_88125/g.189190 Transcript_88125/m.189190 type:complete len:233 (+) Transcript_88125:73-771(+)
MSMATQDENLVDIEQRIVGMETLERKISEKKEQQAFLAGVIAEKQLQCQQAKEQHEERIKALARQSRRQRIRKANKELTLGGGLVSSPDSSTLERLKEVAAPQDQGGGTAALDLQLLDQVLGTAQRRRLLEGDSNGAEAAGGGWSMLGKLWRKAPSEEEMARNSLAEVKEELERRLQRLRLLNARIAKHMRSPPAGQESGVALPGATGVERQRELEALREEVTSLLGVEATS